MSDDKVRAAGVRQEDRLSAGLDTAGVVKAARSAREIGTTTRVYVREWLFDARVSNQEAGYEYVKRYAGRLHDRDVQVKQDDLDDTWVVWTRKFNVNSEWKRPELASAWAQALVEDGLVEADQVECVTRNSRREHVIGQYGVLKLVDDAR